MPVKVNQVTLQSCFVLFCLLYCVNEIPLLSHFSVNKYYVPNNLDILFDQTKSFGPPPFSRTIYTVCYFTLNYSKFPTSITFSLCNCFFPTSLNIFLVPLSPHPSSITPKASLAHVTSGLSPCFAHFVSISCKADLVKLSLLPGPWCHLFIHYWHYFHAYLRANVS